MFKLEKKRARVRKKLSRINNKTRSRVRLKSNLNRLNNEIRKEHLKIERDNFESYINKIGSSNANSVYYELCRIKNKNKRTNAATKCDLLETKAYYSKHFHEHESEWEPVPFCMTKQQHDFAFELFSFDKVRHAAHTANANKMSGDCIPAKALKFLTATGLRLLQSIFIQSYLESQVPHQWQNSSIVEVFKSGNPNCPSRYRPIALIASAFKIYQQMIYYSHLRSLLAAGDRQHGFQSGRSCSTQLMQVLSKIKQINQSSAYLYGLAMDLSQAFDCLRHSTIAAYIANKLVGHDINVLRNIVTQQKFHFRRDPTKEVFNFGIGTPQGGPLSPVVFAFILDLIVEVFDGVRDWIYIYADDIFILSDSFEHLQNLATQITLKLKEFGFIPNIDKFQYFTSSEESEIMIENVLVKQVPHVKYLGIFIDATGICYDVDIESKLNKAKFACSTIKWTKYHSIFRDSYKLFFKCCIMPIIGYGAELYSYERILDLERIRVVMMKYLHAGKYRFHEMNNKYLSMPLYRQLKLLSLNPQLNALNIPTIHSIFDDKEEILIENTRRTLKQWDDQPNCQRASYFKSSGLLIAMATKLKMPNHLKQLVDSFFLGNLPFKSHHSKFAICTECGQEFANLDHFRDMCNEENYLDRETIYLELNSTGPERVIRMLKKLRDSVRIQTITLAANI